MEIVTNRNFVELEDTDIRYIKWRNFDGHPDSFNPKGCLGNFTVVITPDKAEEIEEKFRGREEYAIKVRWKPNRDGDEEPTIKVNLNWDCAEDRKPKIGQRAGLHNRIVFLTEDTVGCLNSAELTHVKLLLNPSKNCGCYLRQGIFTINEYDLFSEYTTSKTEENDEVY